MSAEHSLGEPAVLAFIVIPLVLVAALVGGVAVAWSRSGASSAETARATALTLAGAAGWMALTWAIAASGAFRQWDRLPPPMLLLLLTLVLLALRLSFGGIGRRLADHVPLWALVGIQAFRFPLEIAMHGMYERGVMPVQMSFSGRNFDILTGITALALGARLALGGRGRVLVWLWNVMGLGLLLNVVTVAVLSMPMFAVFGRDRMNVWVADPPFIWLPAVMVLAALAGHLVIFRALIRSHREQRRYNSIPVRSTQELH